MSGFAAYLMELLSAPFRRVGEVTEIGRWMDAQGAGLDELKASLFQARRTWFLTTSSGATLDLHGRDRGLPRLPGEADDGYRRRLQAAYQIYAQGGTKAGMIEAFRLLGYDVQVLELYTVDPLRWNEFEVSMSWSIDAGLVGEQTQPMLDTIARIRPARAKLAALQFDLAAAAAIPHTIAAAVQGAIIGNWAIPVGGVFLDGSRVLDGSWTLSEARSGFKGEVWRAGILIESF